MNEDKISRLRRLQRGKEILEAQAGKAVRPYREDGYVNLMTKYGTGQDSSESYTYEHEPIVPDVQLTSMYESNGLFAKIIDAPAEEALKHGFDLGLKDPDVMSFVEDALDDLDWEEKAATAIKWARLYGGSIIVMLIDDGGGLEEPVNWKNVRSIDELKVYERAVVQPDYSSLYIYDNGATLGNRTSKFGMPEFYDVLSIYGSFRVHESRCLVFRNGVLPERVSNPIYQLWGIPEYVRVRRALQETITAHQDGTKLLERSVQAIYKMKGLASLLTTDDGENQALKRLQIIDMARGMLNSIAIDSEGEDYDFKTFQFAGVKDVVDVTCNMLSAITNIPQSVLFGQKQPSMGSDGSSDLESWYNYIERIQKLMLRRNLRRLLDALFTAGAAAGDVDEQPKCKLKFNPLWSLSETEQATVDKTKADTAMVKAQTAQIYVEMQALDPSEVRSGLAASEDFNVEDLIDEEGEDTLGDLIDQMEENPAVEAAEKNEEQSKTPGGAEQTATPTESPTPPPTAPRGDGEVKGVGILVTHEGKILTGLRAKEGVYGGPGGHIESGETPEQAAARETTEEFGIVPKELIRIGTLSGLSPEYGAPVIFLCEDYDGEPQADGEEMSGAEFMEPSKIAELAEQGKAFEPFTQSLRMLLEEMMGS